jgi:hypothetical protein
MVISAPEITYRIAIQAEGYEPFISNTAFSSDNEIVFTLRKVQK